MSNTLISALSQKASRRLFLGGGAALGALALSPVTALATTTTDMSPAAAGGRAENQVYPPLFDPVACLAYLPMVVRNSWFLIGYLETVEGQRFNCLVHQIINSLPGQPVTIASILNITDITNRAYRGEELVHSADEIALATDRMHNVTPTSTISGDHQTIAVAADFGWGALDMQAAFPGHVMLNAGAGVFPFLGGTPTVQYSIPWGKGSGWLTLNGERREVFGTFWFDRQWGMLQGLFGQPGIALDPTDNWVWMDLNLSNGVVLGLWDLVLSGERYSWVTALYPDGTHAIAELVPLAAGASEVWDSPESGQSYPTRFSVEVPSLGCSLTVTAVMREQEIVSPTEPKYEGVADVTGSFEGEPVTGFTLIEMVGDWHA